MFFSLSYSEVRSKLRTRRTYLRFLPRLEDRRLGAGREQQLLGEDGIALDDPGNATGPARLMTGADPGAGVTVKVLEEEQQVAPVWIVLELVRRRVHRTPAGRVAAE